MNNTRRTDVFIGAMALSAVGASAYAASVSHNLHLNLALAVLALAAATSRMKVKLPGINGNMSMNLPFLLTALVNLSAAEAILIACVSTAVQCWPRKNAKFNPRQVAFNVSMMALASSVASLIFRADWLSQTQLHSATPGLAVATAMLFLGQTMPVAAIVSISEGKSVGPIWWNLVQLSFPYYVVSAGITSMVETVSTHLGWELALAVFPVMVGIHRSYQMYFGKQAETEIQQAVPMVRAAAAGA